MTRRGNVLVFNHKQNLKLLYLSSRLFISLSIHFQYSTEALCLFWSLCNNIYAHKQNGCREKHPRFDDQSLIDWSVKPHRSADPGESAAGHPTHVGQRAAALLLCFLHFRHHRRAAVGGATEEPLLPGRELHSVSWTLCLWYVHMLKTL